MDIRYFLNKRIAFIRQLYETTSVPYAERIRKIETKEYPFVPACTDGDEPPFLEEWIEADESLHVIAYSCVSMLAAAMRLYLETWVYQSGVPVDESLKKSVFKKNGWLAGYKAHFAQHFKIDYEAGPANPRILEEVVLARNRIEHPSTITSHRAQYAKTDLKKLHPPFFVDKREAAFLADTDEGEKSWFMPLSLHVTEEQLLTAVSEVERFAEWFEGEIETRVYAK